MGYTKDASVVGVFLARLMTVLPSELQELQQTDINEDDGQMVEGLGKSVEELGMAEGLVTTRAESECERIITNCKTSARCKHFSHKYTSASIKALTNESIITNFTLEHACNFFMQSPPLRSLRFQC
jgi:hypothetical protein